MTNNMAHNRWVFVKLYLVFYRCLFALLIGFFSLSCLSCAWARSPNKIPSLLTKLPTKTLTIGDHKLKVEIAQTESQRNLGLMHRNALNQNAGMWFVFDRAHPYCFWMKNTLIPLSIAFVNENKVIVDLFDMKPLSETPVCATQAVLYALEVNQGWFDQHRIIPGMMIK